MTLDLTVRPVATRVSSTTQPPRYFLGKRPSGKRPGPTKLSLREVREIRTFAEGYKHLSRVDVSKILGPRYAVSPDTVESVLANDIWFDPRYTPFKRDPNFTPIEAVQRTPSGWLWMVLFVWMVLYGNSEGTRKAT